MQLKKVVVPIISDILRLLVFVKTKLFFKFTVFEFTVSRRHVIIGCKNGNTACCEALFNTLHAVLELVEIVPKKIRLAYFFSIFLILFVKLYKNTKKLQNSLFFYVIQITTTFEICNYGS